MSDIGILGIASLVMLSFVLFYALIKKSEIKPKVVVFSKVLLSIDLIFQSLSWTLYLILKCFGLDKAFMTFFYFAFTILGIFNFLYFDLFRYTIFDKEKRKKKSDGDDMTRNDNKTGEKL